MARPRSVQSGMKMEAPCSLVPTPEVSPLLFWVGEQEVGGGVCLAAWTCVCCLWVNVYMSFPALWRFVSGGPPEQLRSWNDDSDFKVLTRASGCGSHPLCFFVFSVRKRPSGQFPAPALHVRCLQLLFLDCAASVWFFCAGLKSLIGALTFLVWTFSRPSPCPDFLHSYFLLGSWWAAGRWRPAATQRGCLSADNRSCCLLSSSGSAGKFDFYLELVSTAWTPLPLSSFFGSLLWFQKKINWLCFFINSFFNL